MLLWMEVIERMRIADEFSNSIGSKFTSHAHKPADKMGGERWDLSMWTLLVFCSILSIQDCAASHKNVLLIVGEDKMSLSCRLNDIFRTLSLFVAVHRHCITYSLQHVEGVDFFLFCHAADLSAVAIA